MSELTLWLLSLALMIPQPVNERKIESAAERERRVAVVVRAITTAVDEAVMTGAWPGSRRRELAAAALATAVRESGGLSVRVHTGARKGLVGELCYMQINVTNRPGYAGFRFREVIGTDEKSSYKCALAGVRTLVRARRSCQRKVAPRDLLGGILSQYMRGSRCNTNREGRIRLALARDFLRSPLTSIVDNAHWPESQPDLSRVEVPQPHRKAGTLCESNRTNTPDTTSPRLSLVSLPLNETWHPRSKSTGQSRQSTSPPWKRGAPLAWLPVLASIQADVSPVTEVP
jgi:hypothetical protein